jgi:hypothetical protein
MQDFSQSTLPVQLQAAFSYWWHESTPNLNTLNGNLELLRRGMVGPLTSEQQEVIDRAAYAAYRASRCWQHLSLYVTLCSPDHLFPTEALSLVEVIEEVRRQVAHHPWNLQLQTQLPPDLPVIAADPLLPAAVANLVHPEDEHSAVGDFIPTIRVELDQGHNPVVHITTRRLTNMPDHTELTPAQLYPSSCLCTATLILQRCNSRIWVDTTQEDTTFTFGLIAWRDQHDKLGEK